MKYFIILICSVCVFLSISNQAHAALVVKDIRYLNFSKDDNAEYLRWDARANINQINHWAQNRKLQVIGDSLPYTDNSASFVSPYGSGVTLNGLNPNAEYSLFIDFVKYKGGNAGLVSRLVVSAGKNKISEITFGSLESESYFEIKLPRDLYMNGTLNLFFEEYSSVHGLWGVWDLILSTDGLPAEEIHPKKKIPELKDESKKVIDQSSGKKDKRINKNHKTEKKTGSDNPKKDAIVEPVMPKEPDIADPRLKNPVEPKDPSTEKP